LQISYLISIKFKENTLIKIKRKKKKENIIQDKWQTNYRGHYQNICRFF